MFARSLFFVSAIHLAACGGGTSSPSAGGTTPDPEEDALSIHADFDIICAAFDESGAASANADEKMLVLSRYLDEHVQSADGREVLDALANATGDKGALLHSLRADAGHVGECGLEPVLSGLGPAE